MILRYRVSLPNLKGFARVYEVKGNSSLYTFHKQMRSDMDFPQDQIVLFKAFDAEGNVSSRYTMYDMGAGTMDDVTLEQCHKKGEDNFTYFYDTTNAKSVLISFDGVAESRKGVIYPVLVESKGPNPIEFENGYVAYEDLPEDNKRKLNPDDEDCDDDEDFDDDEDNEEEDEDGAEIFDEDEDDQ